MDDIQNKLLDLELSQLDSSLNAGAKPDNVVIPAAEPTAHPTTVIQLKKCKKCGLEKPKDDFRRANKTGAIQTMGTCNLCNVVPMLPVAAPKPELTPQVIQAPITVEKPAVNPLIDRIEADLSKINSYQRQLKMKETTLEEFERMPSDDRKMLTFKLAETVVKKWEATQNPATWFILIGAKMAEDNLKHVNGLYPTGVDLEGYQAALAADKDELDRALNDFWVHHPEIVEKLFTSPGMRLAFILGRAAITTAMSNHAKKRQVG